MNIFKVGHSSVVVTVGETRILIDPGSFTDVEKIPSPETLTALIYTHKHPDHYTHKNLELIKERHPDIPVYTNAETDAVLKEDNHACKVLGDGDELQIGDITIKVWEVDHHPIHDDVAVVKNLALMFNDTFLHPGDALFNPPVDIPVLAMPFGPFASIGECMQYGLEVNPKQIIPLHDGYLSTPGPYLGVPNYVWKPAGISYDWLHNEESIDV